MTFSKLLGTAAAAAVLVASVTPVAAQDWRQGFGTFNVGLLGGENEADRLRRFDCLTTVLGDALGVPVELFPGADYAGVMQGLLAGQLHLAGLGPSAYAGIYLQDPNVVEPFAVTINLDGSLGYYAPMYVRADSNIQTIEDMRGRSLAYADPNSASGYLVPRAELRSQGIVDDEFFGRTGFGGGHEQAVIAVLNGQYDAGVTWSSMLGTFEEGYTRGNLRRMVDNGLLNMSDIRIIWVSGLIANGPMVRRQDLPQEVKDILENIYFNFATDNPDCYASISGGDNAGYAPIDHGFFETIVQMRRDELAGSR